MAAWWDTHITQAFKWGWANGGRGAVGTINGHSGIDLAEVNGTALTSSVTGVIVAAGVRAWGGQVSIRFPSPSMPGGYAVLTHLHMSDIAEGIEEGANVTVGQYIGKTGGASWSSPIPTTCCSTGPHLHFELSAGDEPPYWHTYEPYKPDKNHYPINPTGFWEAIKAAGGPVNDQSGLGLVTPANPASAGLTGSSAASGSNGPASIGQSGPSAGQTAHGFLQEFPGFAGIVMAADAAEQVQPYTPDQNVLTAPGSIFGWIVSNTMAILLRMLLVVLGLGLIVALLYSLAKRAELLPSADDAANAAKLAAVAV
jgi:murein DD-endopeptidase MepM/ murein hydrolase activator NlpD